LSQSEGLIRSFRTTPIG